MVISLLRMQVLGEREEIGAHARVPAALHVSKIDAARILGVASIATTIRVRSAILGTPPKAAGRAAVIGRGALRQPKTRNKASTVITVIIQAAILLPRRSHLF